MSMRVPAPSGKALYRVLPNRAQGMTAEQIAFHQRARLQGAMVAAVAQNGYADTTIKQLVSLAGVSRRTFYKLFADKQQCFLSTYDLIATMATESISRTYRAQEDWRERLRAGFECFAEIVVAERAAAHLVLVDALGVGHRALEHRERVVERLRADAAQSFQSAPHPALVSDTTIRAIVAGIRRVAYRSAACRRTRAAEGDSLRTSWTGRLAITRPAWHRPCERRSPSPGHARLHETLARSTIAPLDPALARATLSHRERILHAVVSLASEGGYSALSIPAISATSRHLKRSVL